MTGTPPLSTGIQAFIETMGLYYEQYGLPRIGGRILGLLTVAGWPLSLDDMAAALQVSRASVSTNVRQVALIGLAEQVSLPGDRRDYYRFPEDALERILLTKDDGIIQLKRIAERGLAALRHDGEELDHSRLEDLADLCDFVSEEMSQWPARWHARQDRRRAQRRSQASPAAAEEALALGESPVSNESTESMDTPA